ncbi:MAG: VanW family protein [Sporomusaceae bacterium]|nr:VanW family protein [Sporomusaceae bacterium]
MHEQQPLFYQRILSSKKSKIIFFFSVVLIFSTIGLVISEASFLIRNRIHDHVSIGDIDVGGLSIEEAEKKIKSVFQQKMQNPPLTAVYQDKFWTISKESIALKINSSLLAQEAYQVGRTDSVMSTVEETIKLYSNKKVTLPFSVKYDQEKLHAILTNIAADIDKAPENGLVTIIDNKIKIIPHTNGLAVDLPRTLGEIAAGFGAKLNFSFPVAVKETVPPVTTDQLADIDVLLATYTTYFNPYDYNRNHNIILSAQRLNNTLVKTAETFSFNNTVGSRYELDGYLQAPGYIDGELVPDWGGGVCQVAGTLYNSILLAGLTVVERTSHLYPPGYVPLGRDATVAYGSLDLKFQNNLAYPVYIITAVTSDTVTINMYGKNLPGAPKFDVVTQYEKSIPYRTVVKKDPTLPQGKRTIKEKGAYGMVISSYRLEQINGKTVKEELLATDHFIPQDRVELLGTKPV